jgi:DMSO/TMAO reductase YedYZ molybdopterin-dependent catalytic subunit
LIPLDNIGAPSLGRREFLRKLMLSAGLFPGYLAVQSLALPRCSGEYSELNPIPPASQGRDSAPITANNDFFVRNHFGMPRINANTWSLVVDGLTSAPLRVSYADLLLMPTIRRAVTFECAGNVSGGIGVGNAIWSGIALADVLRQAGAKSGVTTVILHGADLGDGEGLPSKTNFARAIPVEKAMDASTILAYEMNGSPLPVEHGFPLRALVGGWYGMDSVKWLTRIELSEQPFAGYFQQKQYVALSQAGSRPLTRMLVNSKFLRPSDNEQIPIKTYRLAGVAWAGERKIVKVELRISGGAWQTAKLSTSSAPMVWTAWFYDWRILSPNRYTLEVRATDDEGHTQPEHRDPGRMDAYELNTFHRITVDAVAKG